VKKRELLKLPGRKLGSGRSVYIFEPPVPVRYTGDSLPKNVCLLIAVDTTAYQEALIKIPGWKGGHRGIEAITDGTNSYWWVFTDQIDLLRRL